MSNQYQIRRMSQSEVGLAVEWAEREGWNPGVNDARIFYQADSHGFFIGLLDDKPIAVGSAVCYDDQFAFCGFYIVDPDYRHQGYGLALTKARLAYVGDRNAGIDGVTDMLSKYERLGYRIAHANARYELTSPQPGEAKNNPNIKPYTDSLFPAIQHYDRSHFPALRHIFLSGWLTQDKASSLVWLESGEIKGFAVMRACYQGYKIGPLFADNETIADHLFVSLVQQALAGPVYLDIPENNPAAISLVKRYQMSKVFETARMYLKGKPDLKDKEIFGITSFELG